LAVWWLCPGTASTTGWRSPHSQQARGPNNWGSSASGLPPSRTSTAGIDRAGLGALHRRRNAWVRRGCARSPAPIDRVRWIPARPASRLPCTGRTGPCFARRSIRPGAASWRRAQKGWCDPKNSLGGQRGGPWSAHVPHRIKRRPWAGSVFCARQLSCPSPPPRPRPHDVEDGAADRGRDPQPEREGAARRHPVRWAHTRAGSTTH
jgi:hypothetical protein